jgi:hypothetical protein
MSSPHAVYLHHRIDCEPLRWDDTGKALARHAAELENSGGVLYGVWRSQIGQPRDTLNAITAWRDEDVGLRSFADVLKDIALKDSGAVRTHTVTAMIPTLRPADATPPRRQGNFAFRWSETPQAHWPEFLDLCEQAWPDFESSYDSQVVGLWQVSDSAASDGIVRSLLMTRRPDLAMWERSKIPQGEKEQAMRAKLNRRYDICHSTFVYTTTLLTAEDREDKERWT